MAQRIIIPKGAVDPNETSVIEIPLHLQESQMVVVSRSTSPGDDQEDVNLNSSRGSPRIRGGANQSECACRTQWSGNSGPMQSRPSSSPPQAGRPQSPRSPVSRPPSTRPPQSAPQPARYVCAPPGGIGPQKQQPPYLPPQRTASNSGDRSTKTTPKKSSKGDKSASYRDVMKKELMKEKREQEILTDDLNEFQKARRKLILGISQVAFKRK